MTAIDFTRVYDNEQLQATLCSLATSKHVRDVEVAYWQDGQLLRATVRQSVRPTSEQSNEGYRARVGCLAKSFTAMLVAHACTERRLQLTDRLTDTFRGSELLPDHEALLTSLRILDLLNHTHGLDDSAVQEVVRDSNGCIDLEALRKSVLDMPVLFSAGENFSYSSAGPWLAAAMLERIYRQTYASLAQQKLFAPLNVKAWIGNEPLADALLGKATEPVRMCPAVGGELRMSAQDLVKLYCVHLPATSSSTVEQQTMAASLDSLRQKTFKPRGWQSICRGVGLGVNDFGGGWFGHNSKYRGESVVVRFHPESRIVIAVTSSHEMGALAMLANLFGSSMPQFSGKDTPQFLAPEQWTDIQPDRYVGRYENASLTIAIDVAANKALRVRVYRKSDQAEGNPDPYIKRYLRPAADHVFFSTPAEPWIVPHIQFLDFSNDGAYKYIQNGRQFFVRRK